MLDNLVFYNTFHNGDVHYSREFVKKFSNIIPAHNKLYIHNKHPKITLGCLPHQQAGNMPMEEHVFKHENNLFINTWIGTDHRKYLFNGVTMDGNYAMYTAAAYHIKKLLHIEIPIEPIENYIPEIDFSPFLVDRINDFFTACKSTKVKVFIVNSNVMSGQSENFDFDPIITKLATMHPQVLFFVTNKGLVSLHNVIYTPDINGVTDGCDLVENAYISTKCNIIVGRGSGSFCFSCIKENWLDNSKSILGIGHKRAETLWYDSKNCTFTDNFTNDNIINHIETLIRKHQ